MKLYTIFFGLSVMASCSAMWNGSHDPSRNNIHNPYHNQVQPNVGAQNNNIYAQQENLRHAQIMYDLKQQQERDRQTQMELQRRNNK